MTEVKSKPLFQPLFKIPSLVLRSANVQTFRQYASVVFRGIQQKESEHTLALLQASFLDSQVAARFVEQVKGRINASLPCNPDQEEDVCILPPLFMQSEINQFCNLTGTCVGLVLFDTGPIFPFVRISPATSSLGNTVLSTTLFRLYELIPDFRIALPTDVQKVCDSNNNSQQQPR